MPFVYNEKQGGLDVNQYDYCSHEKGKVLMPIKPGVHHTTWEIESHKKGLEHNSKFPPKINFLCACSVFKFRACGPLRYAKSRFD